MLPKPGPDGQRGSVGSGVGGHPYGGGVHSRTQPIPFRNLEPASVRVMEVSGGKELLYNVTTT